MSENIAQYQPPHQAPMRHEAEKVQARRARAAQDFIPRRGWPDEQERRVPNEIVTRQLLPAYARHLIYAYADPQKKVKGVKVYRTLHMITTLAEFRGYDTTLGQSTPGMSPYNARLYLPYYQGEYDERGRLADPTDPLLYWLIPITEYRTPPADRDEYRRTGGFAHYFVDNVSRHAGCARPIQE
jgi:hypothetical protein